MKSRFLIPALAVSLLTAGTASAQTQLKIGIVDVGRVFREYYKTRESDMKMNADKEKAKKEIETRSGPVKEIQKKLKDARLVLEDRLVNPELKLQKKAEVERLAVELRDKGQKLEEFARRREMQLQEQVMRIRKSLLDEITRKIREKSKKDDYDLVFDKSGMSPSQVPFLLHSKDAVEFSTDVVAELNEGAPKELLNPLPPGENGLTKDPPAPAPAPAPPPP